VLMLRSASFAIREPWKFCIVDTFIAPTCSSANS